MSVSTVIVLMFLGFALVFAADQSLTAGMEEGKLHYDIMNREAKMPRYGECYQDTLRELHEGCSQLTDEIQSRLALAFTNCYLLRFGWPTYPCDEQRTLEDCMDGMDARSASVYSSMLTNTLAMCQFLQAQVWHESTTDAVHSLRSTSEAVSVRLSEAVDSAAALRDQLNSQLLESRETLKSAFSEIKESTAEQRNLIIDIFDKVAHLQALVMGEFSWFYSIVFYVSCVFVTLVATCTPRTLSARLPLLGILALSLLMERTVTALLLVDHHSETLQEDLHAAVWRIRKSCIVASCIWLMKAAFMYRDPSAVTAACLEELALATKEIKKFIQSAPERALETSTAALSSFAKVFDESASSDDTYNPSDDSTIEGDRTFPNELLCNMNNGREGYNLRERSSLLVCQNPIVAMESPEAFERIVKRMESFTRRRSLSQQRQLSHDMGQTNEKSYAERLLPLPSHPNKCP